MPKDQKNCTEEVSLRPEVTGTLVGEYIAFGLGLCCTANQVSVDIERALWWCVLVHEKVGHGGNRRRKWNVVGDAVEGDAVVVDVSTVVVIL